MRLLFAVNTAASILFCFSVKQIKIPPFKVGLVESGESMTETGSESFLLFEFGLDPNTS